MRHVRRNRCDEPSAAQIAAVRRCDMAVGADQIEHGTASARPRPGAGAQVTVLDTTDDIYIIINQYFTLRV